MEETANTFYSHIWSATKKQDESLIEEYSQATVSNLLAACNQMILCLAGFDTVFLISPRIAAEQSQQLDDEWFRGFNFTHEIVCLAAVARKIDVDPYKHLANLAYAFWKGATNIQDTKSDLVQLFSPGIKALYNLKRALLIEMAKGIDSSAISAPAQKPSREIQVSTDNESRELILVGQVIAIVAEAGQIY